MQVDPGGNDAAPENGAPLHPPATALSQVARRPLLGLLVLVLTCGILVAAPGSAHAEDDGGPAVGGASLTSPDGFKVSGATAGPIEVGSTHTVTAALEDSVGDPIAGASVDFEVTSGPNVDKTATATTDTAGVAAFDLTSPVQGTDSVTATVTVDGQQKTATYSVQWLRRPAAPVITSAVAGNTTLTVDIKPAVGDGDAALSGIRVTVSPGDLVQTLPAAGGTATSPSCPTTRCTRSARWPPTPSATDPPPRRPPCTTHPGSA